MTPRSGHLPIGLQSVRLPSDARLSVAGSARLFGSRLYESERDALTRALGDHSGPAWTMLFVHLLRPGTGLRPTRWTLLTADTGYAEAIASSAGGPIDLPMCHVRDRFPVVVPGWIISGDRAAQALAAATMPAPRRLRWWSLKR